MEWTEIVQTVVSIVIGTGIGKLLGVRALKSAARVIDDLADGKITAEEAKRQKQELTKMLNWLKKKIKKSNYLLLIVPIMALLIGGCVSSRNGSIQSGPISYTEGAAGETPYIHTTVHVVFRSVPSRGAIGRFTDHLGRLLNDLNVVSAVTAIGSQPERMVAKLEDGTRAHLAIPIRVPIVKGRDTEISVSTSDVREAAKEALDRAEVETAVDGITCDTISLTIRSTVVNETQSEN